MVEALLAVNWKRKGSHPTAWGLPFMVYSTVL